MSAILSHSWQIILTFVIPTVPSFISEMNKNIKDVTNSPKDWEDFWNSPDPESEQPEHPESEHQQHPEQK